MTFWTLKVDSKDDNGVRWDRTKAALFVEDFSRGIKISMGTYFKNKINT